MCFFFSAHQRGTTQARTARRTTKAETTHQRRTTKKETTRDQKSLDDDLQWMLRSIQEQEEKGEEMPQKKVSQPKVPVGGANLVRNQHQRAPREKFHLHLSDFLRLKRKIWIQGVQKRCSRKNTYRMAQQMRRPGGCLQ